MVLALTNSVPIVIQPKTSIAIAIALPMNIAKQNKYQETLLLTNQNVYQEMPFENPSPVPDVLWVEHVGCEQPKPTCSLTHPGETVYITGMWNTVAVVTMIAHRFWPSGWNFVAPMSDLTGIGGATVCKVNS